MNKRRIAIIGSAGLLSIAGLTACGSSSSNTGSTTNAAAAAPSGGGAPSGTAPQMGTEAAGTDATNASAAATAKYDGTVDRVMKLDDGSYVVGVTTDDGMVLVQVSADFAVTGTQQGPPSGGTPPQGGTPPSNATS